MAFWLCIDAALRGTMAQRDTALPQESKDAASPQTMCGKGILPYMFVYRTTPHVGTMALPECGSA